MAETGWIIEGGNEPHYWTGRGSHDFSLNVDDALRFARRVDAEDARAWICRNHALRVTEHLWVSEQAPGQDTGSDIPGGGAY